jgi:hypothetical protein
VKCAGRNGRDHSAFSCSVSTFLKVGPFTSYTFKSRPQSSKHLKTKYL